MARKHPGMKVVVLVSHGEDRQLRTTIESDEAGENWDNVGRLLRATAEELRTIQREPREEMESVFGTEPMPRGVPHRLVKRGRR